MARRPGTGKPYYRKDKRAHKRAGRPFAITRSQVDAVAANVRLGMFPYHAAVAAGIKTGSFYRAMQTGQDKKAKRCIAHELVEAIEKARAFAVKHSVEILSKCKDPRTHQWLLSKLDPVNYGDSRELAANGATSVELVEHDETVEPVNDQTLGAVINILIGNAQINIDQREAIEVDSSEDDDSDTRNPKKRNMA